MANARSAPVFSSVGFLALALLGLLLAAMAAACGARQQQPSNDGLNQTDPARAETVEPNTPRGDAGLPPSEPQPQGPNPTPPGQDPVPAPDPQPAPNPVPPTPDRGAEPGPAPG
jgi:hypothetical protein